MNPTPQEAERARSQRELLDMLSFNLEDGRIWLYGKRMMMLDVASFGALRSELIARLGLHGTRSVLTRIGYASGASDAAMIRQRWPDDYHQHAAIGSYLHRLEGIAKIVPVRVNSVPERKHFDAEYLWQHAVEDDVHIVAHGLGTEPACWMEVGYATGYVSSMCEQLILFREIECRSMGSAACRVISAPATDWDAIDEDLAYLGLPDPRPARRRLGREAPGVPLAALAGPRAQGLADGLGEGAAEGPAEGPGAAGAPGATRPIIGQSAALTAARSLLGRVAPTQATVLITGESGVGKELFARAVHQQSRRAAGPFVAVNCAAIPDTLIESELFGVERGAFTGAQASRAGRFERAAGGTLFLDEIAALSPVAQTKLLRVLQEGELERVGGTRVLRPDVRVVAAANVNLRQAAAQGAFREDLFFRLNVFPIELPPLRERRDDIPALVAHFLARYSALHGRRFTRLSPRALQALLLHRYPGNIRELERIIERAVILADGDELDLAHVQLPGDPGADAALLFISPEGRLAPWGASPTLGGALDADLDALAMSVVAQCEAGQAVGVDKGLERIGDELLTRVMRIATERQGGNVSAAARLIGVKRHQVEYRIKPRPEPL